MTKDLTQLRQLVRDRMLERGGGAVPETYTDAARLIGVSQPTLHIFLNDEKAAVKVETCLRLANYLELPRATVLRLAGYDSIATILGEPESPLPDDQHLRQVAAILAPFTDEQKAALVGVLRAAARALSSPPPPPTRPYNIRKSHNRITKSSV